MQYAYRGQNRFVSDAWVFCVEALRCVLENAHASLNASFYNKCKAIYAKANELSEINTLHYRNCETLFDLGRTSKGITETDRKALGV